jgi:hypothetical protein
MESEDKLARLHVQKCVALLYESKTMILQNHGVLASFLLFSCASQAGVDTPSWQKKSAQQTHTNSSFSIHGHWEAQHVNNVMLEKLSQEEIPFRMLFLGEDGTMRMDNFLTEYELLSTNGRVFSMSYSMVGQEKPFRVEILDAEQARFFCDSERSEVQVTLRKVP